MISNWLITMKFHDNLSCSERIFKEYVIKPYNKICSVYVIEDDQYYWSSAYTSTSLRQIDIKYRSGKH